MLDDNGCRDQVQKFQRQLRYFKKAVAGRKEYSVADGIMRDAIFCMSDFSREFRQFYLHNQCFMSANEFKNIMSSDYASQIDKKKYQRQSRRIENLQKNYLGVLEIACRGFHNNCQCC